MRAAVLHAFNEPFVVEEVELAPPAQGEVRVKIVASGVCHTDLSIQRGLLPLPPPRIIGHEGAGVVEEIGPGVLGLVPGDHVVLSFMYPCGCCPECGRGHPVHCDAALAGVLSGRRADGAASFTLNGREIPHWVGTFAEHTVVPELACVKIRREVPLDKACLVGCGARSRVQVPLLALDHTPSRYWP